MQFNRIMSHGHMVRQAASCVCEIQFATCTGKTKTYLTDQFIPYKIRTRSRDTSICIYFSPQTNLRVFA